MSSNVGLEPNDPADHSTWEGFTFPPFACHLIVADPDGNAEAQLMLEGPIVAFNLPEVTVTPACPVVPEVHTILAFMSVVTDAGVSFNVDLYFTAPTIEHCRAPVALNGDAVAAPAVDGVTRSAPARRTSTPTVKIDRKGR
jgi:hypothetical protein